MDDEQKIQALKEYFAKRADVVMAFLFGSRAKGYARSSSDWDIGVYFKLLSPRELELEESRDYPERSGIWGDVEKIVGAQVDLVALNSVASPMVFSVLNSGIPLVMKDRLLYLRLLLKTHYEAVDFWRFTREFWRIRERSHSLSSEDQSDLIKHIVFLENELQDLSSFQGVTQEQYTHDRMMKRNIERWVENLVMASLDIAKIILSSEKKNVPDSYRETLRSLGLHYFDESFAEQFADFAELRNLVAHEYLDLRWKRILGFIPKAAELYPRFLERMKNFVEES